MMEKEKVVAAVKGDDVWDSFTWLLSELNDPLKFRVHETVLKFLAINSLTAHLVHIYFLRREVSLN